MLIDIIEAKYFKDYKIIFTFENGKQKVVDFKNELWGEMFEPLKDLKEFKNFIVNKEFGTIVWKNGADVSPETMYKIGIPVSKEKLA